MIDLLKAFGRGVLYVLALPFFLVALALFAVIGLGDFIFQICKSIVFFFTGQKFFPELPEDRELRLRRENAAQQRAAINEQLMNNQDVNRESPVFHDYQQAPAAPRREEPVIAPNPAPQNPHVEQPYLKREEPKEVLERPIREEPREDTIKPSFEQEKEEEVLEEYHPKGSHIVDSYEDEDTDNGVNIGFDD